MISFIKSFVGQTSMVRLTYHRAKALVAALLYGFPARHLIVIGITGTDGKTTTVGMISHIFNKSGKKCGALSTAFLHIGGRTTWNATQKTSPSPFIIQKFLRQCVREGCTHVVLECSSHGLLQGRVDYTWPSVAGITNLSQEHLDYHGSMQNYLHAKSILFSMLRKKTGVAVLNADDQSYAVLKSINVPFEISYSMQGRTHYSPISACPAGRLNPSPDGEGSTFMINSGVPPPHRGRGLGGGGKDEQKCDLLATNIKANIGSVGCKIQSSNEPEFYDVSIPISGAFNISNALCAIGCAYSLNIPLSDCASALSTFTGIPGRMEKIDAGQPFAVYIDFTVTPQSYESTLSTLKKSLQPSGRLLVLTGSCGDRMKEKRPIVGKIVSTYADITVVANEDPYTEDPEKIIDDVWVGIDQSTTEAHRIFDRLKAIQFLLREARADDIVIFCGKGSDTTMMMKDGQVPWNERDIVMNELKKLSSAS